MVNKISKPELKENSIEAFPRWVSFYYEDVEYDLCFRRFGFSLYTGDGFDPIFKGTTSEAQETELGRAALKVYDRTKKIIEESGFGPK